MKRFIVFLFFALPGFNIYSQIVKFDEAFEVVKNIILNQSNIEVYAAKYVIKSGSILRTLDGIEISPDNGFFLLMMIQWQIGGIPVAMCMLI